MKFELNVSTLNITTWWPYLLSKWRTLMQDPVCVQCRSLLPQQERQALFCVSCAEQMHIRDAFPLTRTPLLTTYSATLFNSLNKRLLYRYKFQNQHYLAQRLSQLLVAYWNKVLADAPVDLAHDNACVQSGYSGTIVVTCIPAHQKLQAAEDSDSQESQSEDASPTNSIERFAKEFASHFGYAYAPNLLSWSRPVVPQHTLSGKKRRFSNIDQSMSVAYQKNPKLMLSARRVLIIDDIHTTGATMQEAAAAFARCPAYDGTITGLTLTHLALTFQKSLYPLSGNNRSDNNRNASFSY